MLEKKGNNFHAYTENFNIVLITAVPENQKNPAKEWKTEAELNNSENWCER